MNRSLRLHLTKALVFSAGCAFAKHANADDATPGYPEAVIQWGVQPGETCDTIATAEYGSVKFANLVLRYNRVDCAKLVEGTTLVLPAKVTEQPTAHLKSMHPNVRQRPAGGAWAPGATGEALGANHNVNTLDDGRADIEFADRSRVFLAPHTLVVIYGTAAKTKVSKTKPSTVELEEGEVRAGLAALRGGAVDIALQGGGTVSATSRDAVVSKKKTIATISVFDGKANVTSAGKSVEVPKDFGNKVEEGKAPTPPQPLPPAPTLTDQEGPIELAPEGVGVLHATWSAVPKARAYRVEVARDAAFEDLVVREEAAADILAARIEKMPPGGYFFRVRAIDSDDFLGLPAGRRVELVGASLGPGGGTVTSSGLATTRFATLTLKGPARLVASLDDGPAEAAPEAIDLGKLAPKIVHLKVADGDPDTAIAISYAPFAGTLRLARNADGSIQAEGTIDGVPEANRGTFHPKLQFSQGPSPQHLDLRLDGAARFTASIPDGAQNVGLFDEQGVLLASSDAPPENAPPPPLPVPFIGVVAPLLPASPASNVEWIAPTARSAGSISGGYETVRSSDASFQGVARASGNLGVFSFDARVASRGSKARSDDGAWLGGRVRFYRQGLAAFEAGLFARAAIPTSTDGAPTRGEVGLAFGGQHDALGWVVDGGLRFRAASDAGRTPVPTLLGFGIVGGTYDPTRWLRGYLMLDGHGASGGGFQHASGGGTVGAEVGTTIFGSIAVRGAPFKDVDSAFVGMLSIGARSF